MCTKEGSSLHLPVIASIFSVLYSQMFLRQLAECTSDPEQKTRILQLCSRQGNQPVITDQSSLLVLMLFLMLGLGSVEYGSLIREQFTSFLDVLDAFPACMPTLSIVLEGLPRLQPRPYSVTRLL